MLRDTLAMLAAPELMMGYLDKLFEQYPGHRAHIRRIREQKRRSEYVHVTIEVGGPVFTVVPRQLSRMSSNLVGFGQRGQHLRKVIVQGEIDQCQPVLFEMTFGDRRKFAVIAMRGVKLAGASVEAEEAPATPGASPNQALFLLLAALLRRTEALEDHLVRHGLEAPEFYPGLIGETDRLRSLVAADLGKSGELVSKQG